MYTRLCKTASDESYMHIVEDRGRGLALGIVVCDCMQDRPEASPNSKRATTVNE